MIGSHPEYPLPATLLQHPSVWGGILAATGARCTALFHLSFRATSWSLLLAVRGTWISMRLAGPPREVDDCMLWRLRRTCLSRAPAAQSIRAAAAASLAAEHMVRLRMHRHGVAWHGPKRPARARQRQYLRRTCSTCTTHSQPGNAYLVHRLRHTEQRQRPGRVRSSSGSGPVGLSMHCGASALLSMPLHC